MDELEAPQSPPPAAGAFSAVLDDDDLLCEILLRVAFPTSLVRAALVCKRWLRLASAPAFLRRFRGLHPPRLLGFYVTTRPPSTVRFMPIPQPPELSDVVRRSSFYLNTLGWDDLDVECRNGLLVLSLYTNNQPNKTVKILRCPLYPARYTTILPPLPSIHDGFTKYDIANSEILINGVGDGMSCFYFAIASKEQLAVIDLYMLQDDTWAMIYSSAVSDEIVLLESTLLCDDKIYSMAYVNKTWMLFLLDLESSTLSLVNLPEQVNFMSLRLSLAHDDSGGGVHLVAHLKDFQIRIWLHRMDNNDVSTWFLVNTISLREICTDNMIPSCVFEDDEEFITMYAVGENFEFVLLEKDDAVYMFDLERKAANKVYEAQEKEHVYSVSPFMMVWPPKFPASMEGYDLVAETKGVKRLN